MVLLESCSPHLSQLNSESGNRYGVKFCSGPLAIALLDAVTEIRLCTQLVSPCFVLCWSSEIKIVGGCIYSFADNGKIFSIFYIFRAQL